MSTVKPDSNSLTSRLSHYGKWVFLALVLFAFIIVISFITSFYYTVDQNEVAGVTRNGALISEKPVGPGLHFKWPIVDAVHKTRVSQEKIPIDDITVKTVDNQFAKINLNLTYHTADPFKSMFKVGQMGTGGVIDQVVPFVRSRTLQVFGQVSALKISDQQAALALDILKDIQEKAISLFGEQIDDVQITAINYSEGFEKNIEQMVQTMNQQVQAANILKVRQIEAEQSVATATGQANSAAATADGQKRVAIATAEGDAKKTILQADANFYAQKQTADAAAYTRKVQSETEAKAQQAIGDAQAEVYASKIKAAGNADAYASLLRAEASNKWTGGVPSIELSGTEKGGASPIFVLPQTLTK